MPILLTTASLAVAGNYTPLGFIWRKSLLARRGGAEPIDVAAELVRGRPQSLGVGTGGGELVLQADDRLGRGERVAVVQESPHAGGEAELIAGVAPVATGGAVRLQDAGAVQAAQERGLDAEQLGGLAHGQRGKVVVVEPAQRVGCARLPVVGAHRRPSCGSGRRRGAGSARGTRPPRSAVSSRPPCSRGTRPRWCGPRRRPVRRPASP